MNTTAAAVSHRAMDARVLAFFQVMGVTLAMVIAAQIRVPLPWTPVPVTLQTFVVLAAAFAVGPRRATWGIALYLLMGLTQAPVFAAASFVTMGYLLAFLAAPVIITRFARPAVGILVASLLIYALGTAWLMAAAGIPAHAAIMAGVAPFVPGDAIKAAAAYGVARALRES